MAALQHGVSQGYSSTSNTKAVQAAGTVTVPSRQLVAGKRQKGKTSPHRLSSAVKEPTSRVGLVCRDAPASNELGHSLHNHLDVSIRAGSKLLDDCGAIGVFFRELKHPKKEHVTKEWTRCVCEQGTRDERTKLPRNVHTLELDPILCPLRFPFRTTLGRRCACGVVKHASNP